MLNLTESAITLLAQTGETTEIPASGYIARVETMRRKYYHIIRTGESGGEPYADVSPPVPIIEETPTEIVCESKFWGGAKKLGNGMNEDDTNDEGWFGVGDSQLLLVTREVAEAAHALGHPLWDRMVWADEVLTAAMCVQDESIILTGYERIYNGFTPKKTFAVKRNSESHLMQSKEIIGYQALRRIPQGETHA